MDEQVICLRGRRLQVDRREQVLDGGRHVDALTGNDQGATVPEVLLVDALDVRDDGGLVQIRTEPPQVENRLEVGPIDEGERFLGRSAVGSLPGVGQLAAQAIHLRP
ncbi:MAG: hypothetical protein JRG67_03125 [Deltaproteobacteria bacterium]|nr:hypothetical protein [Deltaproteobacteria bacterium]